MYATSETAAAAAHRANGQRARRGKGKAGTRADSSQHPKPNRAATGDGRRHQRTPNKHTETQPARQRERAPAHRSRAKGRRRDNEARGRRRQSTPNPHTETSAGAPNKLTLRVQLPAGHQCTPTQPSGREQLPAGHQCAWHSTSGRVQHNIPG